MKGGVKGANFRRTGGMVKRILSSLTIDEDCELFMFACISGCEYKKILQF